MAKLRQVHITIADIEDYQRSESSFALELRTLDTMTRLGFVCQHGGLYTDEITKKTREFDIRASRGFSFDLDGHPKCVINYALAIECKSLGKHYPLVLSTVPSLESETFVSVLISAPQETMEQWFPPQDRFRSIMEIPRGIIRRVPLPECLFSAKQYVGKSLTQIGKDEQGQFKTEDREVYDKWTQAISSLHEMIDVQLETGERNNAICMGVSFPMVVVPDECLYTAQYSCNGRLEQVKPALEALYYVGAQHRFDIVTRIEGEEHITPHLLFVTESRVEALMTEWIENPQLFNPYLQSSERSEGNKDL
jgi:hypothetical protein